MHGIRGQGGVARARAARRGERGERRGLLRAAPAVAVSEHAGTRGGVARRSKQDSRYCPTDSRKPRRHPTCFGRYRRGGDRFRRGRDARRVVAYDVQSAPLESRPPPPAPRPARRARRGRALRGSAEGARAQWRGGGCAADADAAAI
eukprot:scaffold106981_cov61-Phaeocystis_antarctica.AAC.1